MAHAAQVSREVLDQLASGMSGHLRGLANSFEAGVRLEFREVFKVFSLGLAEIMEPVESDRPFAQRVSHPHKGWHVQLFQGDRPVGYVMTKGANAPVVFQGVFLSSLAQAIDEAIRKIDAEERPGDGNPEVNLLVAPSHHLHMLWIRRNARQIVALETDLKRDEPYDEKDILSRLQSIPPIVGLGRV